MRQSNLLKIQIGLLRICLRRSSFFLAKTRISTFLDSFSLSSTIHSAYIGIAPQWYRPLQEIGSAILRLGYGYRSTAGRSPAEAQ
ncbi:hypothetical protein [Sphingobacterium yanglingense]|uniref:hypothetical protein n=1 Tax=Sphingobacterium yanglingense TaxID=1437280 RepID=UPI00105D12A0|nr:hypothetical protein [Sphingobacterium yanglingense]